MAIDYWNHLTDRVAPWGEIREGDVKPPEARQNFISSYALALWALGAAGKATLAAKRETDRPWADHLDKLKNINWKKTNPDWQGICMSEHEVITRMPTRRATALYIMWRMGISPQRPKSVISDTRQETTIPGGKDGPTARKQGT